MLAALILVAVLSPSRAHASDLAQTAGTTNNMLGQALGNTNDRQLYLFPAESTPVSVEVHIAELWVSAQGAANFVDVDATYRLKNAETDPASPLIRLATSAGGEQGVAQLPHITNITVSVADPEGDQPIALEESANGNYTFQVNVDADAKLTLRLRYRVALGEGALPIVHYPLEPLGRWPGPISIRAEVKVPDTIAADSWTYVEPDGWSYGLATDPGRVDVKWLYSERAPAASIVFQYANPNLWQQIRALELTPPASRTFQQYARLGDAYRQLYTAAGLTPALRDRYLAQAVAAYTSALAHEEAASTANEAERGAMHYNLAQLYRGHAPSVTPQQANEYARLMVEHVDAALGLLPDDDSRFSEIARWRADGLTLLLNQARADSEWDRALALVDELARLPAGTISPELLADTRADLEVQKALELLAQGQRDAAFAVAGAQLAGAELQPPRQMQNLFLRWALTVTASADQIEIIALGQTDPELHSEALDAARNMSELFSSGATRRSSAVAAQAQDADWQGTPAILLEIGLENGTDTSFLADLTPTGMDWILLRTLLSQLAVDVTRARGVIWQTVTLRQDLDLGAATTQWTSMANSLERQAQEFEAAAADQEADNQGQDALAARIRATHYRAMAERWRDLIEQSRLYFELHSGELDSGELDSGELHSLTAGQAGSQADSQAGIQAEVQAEVQTEVQSDAAPPVLVGGALPTRAWFTAVAGPSQVFTMQTQLLNVTQLLVIAGAAFALLLALSALLWWLL